MSEAVSDALTLHVPARSDAIAPAGKAAEEWVAGQQGSDAAIYFASLAIEELVTNCIKYGYDDEREHMVEIELSALGDQLRMVVIDDGRPFDPLQAAPPDLTLPLEQRPIGGLGIHLLREMADDLRYERRGGTNRLTLLKRMR